MCITVLQELEETADYLYSLTFLVSGECAKIIGWLGEDEEGITETQ